MLFYLVIFAISISLFHLASKQSYRKIGFWLTYLIFILLLSLIEGCRDLTIGTDLDVYGIRYFEDARRSHHLIKYISELEGEWGYHTFMWLCARLSSDIHVMLFVSALLKIVLASVAYLKMRNQLNPTLLMFSYLCFSYVTGFNIMRQALAASIVIFALPYLLERKWIPYLILSLLAMTLHSSAFMSIVLAALYFVTKMKGGIWLSLIIIAIIYSFSFAIMAYIQILDLGLYSDKASLYLEKEGVTTAKSNIVIACLCILFVLRYRSYLKTNHSFDYFFLLVVTSLFLTFMSSYFEVAVRLSWYIFYLLGLMYTIIIKKLSKRRLLSMTYIVIFVMYFMLEALHGLGNCLPYKSVILGI